MNDDELDEVDFASLATPIAAGPLPPDHPAAVTPVPLTPQPLARALGVQLPDNWALADVAALVSDIASNMYDIPFLLTRHKLTQAQFDRLKDNEFYQRALEAEVLTWQGANTIQKRLALEAAIAVERALPDVATRMQNKHEPLGDVVALMKLFSEMAGVIGNKTPVGAASSEKFKIVINLGADTLSREAPVIDVTGAVTEP